MTQFWPEEKDKKKDKTPCNKQGWPILNDIVHTFRGGGRFENITAIIIQKGRIENLNIKDEQFLSLNVSNLPPLGS